MNEINNSSWTDQAWEKSYHIYKAILGQPFVQSLADGTLPKEIFERYIAQDSLYLNTYSKVLSHIASRLNDTDMSEAFMHFALDGVAVERDLHARFLSGKTAYMSPSCLLYTSLLNAQATAPVEVEAAAVLPCFWIYQEVGKHIASISNSDNPYSKWIETYSDEAFAKSTNLAKNICDKLAQNASERVRQRMTEIFVECTRMEWLFWHGAYIDLKWPQEII